MSEEQSIEFNRTPETFVPTEAELRPVVRYWTQVFWDQLLNHFCNAVSDPSIEAAYVTDGETDIIDCAEINDEIMERDDMILAKQRLHDIAKLGPEKVGRIREEFLAEIQSVRCLLIPFSDKTRQEISTLLTAYQQQKLKNEQTLGISYVRCRELEPVLKAPYEICVKAAARAVGLEYRQFRLHDDWPIDIDRAWDRFVVMTDYWDRSSVERIVDSVQEEFQEKNPREWHIYAKGNPEEREALREQHVLNIPCPECGRLADFNGPVDWAWVDEETAFHRQGHCRVHGDEHLKNRLRQFGRRRGQ